MPASARLWSSRGFCTARSNAAPLIPSIKRAAGLVYPQNRKNVGKSTKMQKRWVFWISALKRPSAPSSRPLWSCAAKSRWKRSVSRSCATAPCINKSTFYAHYQDIYALANAIGGRDGARGWWKACPRLDRQRCEASAPSGLRGRCSAPSPRIRPRSACCSPAPGRGCSSTGWNRPCASASPDRPHL